MQIYKDIFRGMLAGLLATCLLSLLTLSSGLVPQFDLVTLSEHLVYGLALGVIYRWLAPR